ncbi:Uncharacterized protein YmfQ in lambdoid prophage, DUF2313 family [Methylomagnum ishizawai]|uniref:Uncharacterized protein YmfQ in lambdoid prophage, DUF2313 family n=1 Tax=Methylomagnum ishizawai TaxID=1760988 RepID=A0A1Y6D1U4_9GAMM|nr:putative phage tail protein [Methylomagnum ishizawai]SMF94364.1 Uncharacterized protein YmfQ in lambdoid prophage, DUF2313 family [Methylomagnum ishizawai]
MDLTGTDYLSMLQALLPRGPVWAGAGRMGQVLQSWADEFALVDARIRPLLLESEPETVDELLPDWEAEFGLPEPCDPEAEPTDGERRTRLAAKVHYLADHTEPGWQALAARYGATLRLESFQPSEAGLLVAGGELLGDRARYSWRVVVLTPTITVREPICGDFVAGDRLGDWDRLPIECAIRRRNHAHLIPIFGYTED